MGPGIQQGLIDDHKSQTDRMTSVFLLSDVDVALLYPNQNVIAPGGWISTVSPYRAVTQQRVPPDSDGAHWDAIPNRNRATQEEAFCDLN